MKYEYDVGQVIAIIPARSGSKGIIDKNIYSIKGFPLVSYSIAIARVIKEINRVIVSTNSERYAQIAQAYGGEVPFMRPDKISGADSLDIDYLRHTLDGIFSIEGRVPEFVVLLRPTTPLRIPSIIEEAIRLIRTNARASAIVSVHALNKCPYKWMILSESGYLRSPFHELSPDDVNRPRQSFPLVYEPDGYVDVLRSKVILEEKLVYGNNALPLFIDFDVIDIDTQDDLDRIEKCDVELYEIYKYLSDRRIDLNHGV